MSEPQKTTAPPAPAARPLPSEADVAAWAAGAELPVVGALLENLDVAKYDLLQAQIRKEELLPQHWQVLTARPAPAEADFDRLPEVERLRARGAGEARVEALRWGWLELRGKRPGLWEAADVFAAFRRILQNRRPLKPYDFLTAIRDVWRDLPLPRGREQLAILTSCLVQARRVTKK
ncbi:MAG: hypothetical protein ACM3OB_03470 [Acidobacteriota bacterium]